MSYGKVRTPGVIEAYYVDPECPDDMYMTPDSKFWASCAGQQSKASFYPAIVGIIIVLLIILTVMYLFGVGGLGMGITFFVGLGIIGYSAFYFMTAEKIAETMHREAMMSLETNWSIDYDSAWEEKDGRRVWKEDIGEKLRTARDERRQQIIAEKAVATQISMSQGGPGGSAASASNPETFTGEIGKGIGSGIASAFKNMLSSKK
jgi:hypothetical protein